MARTPSAPHSLDEGISPESKDVFICGPPNVGKSVIFGELTGCYATVSNYPGTTVEVMTAKSAALPGFTIIDTPGAYSLLPISDEERVTREILLKAEGSVALHVVDAKNLRRMLPMTLELLELNLRVVLILNIMDEAKAYGVRINTARLSKRLGIPVLETVATKGLGIDKLVETINRGIPSHAHPEIEYSEACPVANPVDPEADRDPDLELSMRRARQALADDILSETAVFPPVIGSRFSRFCDQLTLNPLTAIPIALLVLYFGVYIFVGKFGAGTLVNFLEADIYDQHITPWLTRIVEHLLPWPILQDLFVHEYGMLTLGLRYAIALILPIVGTFFLLFSSLEDSGYLPRLALLLDRIFKKLGLNGRAVIPIVLGFGCGTMATMVTRILETRRERVIATILLGVAIPCSAQLGVIMAMLAGKPTALIAWCIIMAVIFVTLGAVVAAKLPGSAPSFYLEIPPMRMPKLSNVLVKTYSRMHWYFVEILPLFLAASVVIWLGNLTGLFNVVINMLKPVVAAMGLPAEAARSFLFGFFRRDYGAAGLFELQRDGKLTAQQSFVSVLVITLFLPCVAQFSVMKKERGWRFTLLSSVAILVSAMGAGIIAHFVLSRTGWM